MHIPHTAVTCTHTHSLSAPETNVGYYAFVVILWLLNEQYRICVCMRMDLAWRLYVIVSTMFAIPHNSANNSRTCSRFPVPCEKEKAKYSNLDSTHDIQKFRLQPLNVCTSVCKCKPVGGGGVWGCANGAQGIRNIIRMWVLFLCRLLNVRKYLCDDDFH